MRMVFFALCFAVALGFGMSSAHAQQQNQQFQAPPGQWVKDPNYKAPNTAQEKKLPDFLQYKGVATDAADLNTPHRSDEEILMWAQQASAEALTMNYQDYDQRLEDVRQYFNDVAYQQYVAYLQETKMIERITRGAYIMNTVASGDAFIHKKAPLEGAYRWLVELPLIVSFFQEDRQGKLQSDVQMNGEIKLLIQIGRTPNMSVNQGIEIQSWKVRRAPAPK